MMTKSHKRRQFTAPSLTRFTFYPNSFKFGADLGLTVITAYLHPEDSVKALSLRRRTSKQTGEPIALIVTYDIEDGTLQLLCIDSNDTQCRIPLRPNEQANLYKALCQTIISIYGATPEECLAEARAAAHLPQITVTHPPKSYRLKK